MLLEGVYGGALKLSILSWSRYYPLFSNPVDGFRFHFFMFKAPHTVIIQI